MAYMRCGSDCDVYMYKGFDGKFHFHLGNRCPKPHRSSLYFSISTEEQAIRRIKRLRAQGYRMSDQDFNWAIERLEEEIQERGGR